jgi:hypothetical protein
MTAPAKNETAAPEAAPIESLGLSAEVVEQRKQEMAPETFREFVSPPAFAYHEYTQMLEVDDDVKVHPLMRAAILGKAEMGEIAKRLNAVAQELNRNPRLSGQARNEDWVPVIESYIKRLTQKEQEVDQALGQIATAAKAIVGDAVATDFPPDDAERAQHARMAGTYVQLSPAEKKQWSGDPAVMRMKLWSHPLEWNGTVAEQAAVRLQLRHPVVLNQKQQQQMSTLRGVAATLQAVKQDEVAARKAAVASCDQRLASARGLVPKPISALTGKQRSDLISKIGLDAYERRLAGLE